jgi:hypothetical protein
VYADEYHEPAGLSGRHRTPRVTGEPRGDDRLYVRAISRTARLSAALSVIHRAYRPGAVGLFGMFQLDLGNRYVWILQDGPHVTRTMVMAMARVDTAAMMREVETKVFGSVDMAEADANGGTQ